MRAFTCVKAYMDGCAIPYRTDATGRDSTTFKVGGPLALLAEPSDAASAEKLISYITEKEIPYYIIGNGSNLLIPDEGVDKLFIRFAGELADFRIEGNELICGAGASMASAAKRSVAEGLMGLEWAAGIPGTVGGAVAMNAGAYGGEIKQVLKEVTVIEGGKLKTVKAEDSAMGYRRSAYSFPGMTVLEAVFSLRPDDGGAASRMEDYSRRRREKQPLSYPSAGSTFKRPEGHFAGALIEKAGLKGFSVGGAQVSEKHAGFVINTGNATASDVMEVIRSVRQAVFESEGVMLEPEVKIL
ncbi:MAG: UDP-N-acetylmuramate dehydrogenase [Clostridia bacterium]|nr:UDP-N-acetylmuramate dehydrogenase [Clostridia bacterium]